jgi:copper-containing nitrite reductase
MERRTIRHRWIPTIVCASFLVLTACARPSGDLKNVDPAIAYTVGQERIAAQVAAQILPVTIHASSLHMDPSALTIPAGRPVQLTYMNHDTVSHRLVIPQLQAKVITGDKLTTLSGSQTPATLASILKDVPPTQVTFTVDPGQTVVTTFVAENAGTFNLECTVPGHSEAGMVTTVVVTSNAAIGALAATPTAAPTVAPAATTAPATPQPSSGGHVMVAPNPVSAAHPARDPALPPIPAGDVKQVTFTVTDQKIDVGAGMTLSAWTFGGSIPGPVLHVRQGDTVQFTLTNNSTMTHSIDFHAARTAPNVNYKNVLPNTSFTFTWKASDAGVFMYHCGTAPILQHLAEGMYGAVVVDPANQPLPAVDREFVFVQSEFYLTPPQEGIAAVDYQKAQTGTADLVVFNGYANQYADHPIAVKVGEKIRTYVVNAGPNHFSAYHVVGTLFDHVWVDGNPANDLRGIQTWTVAPGEGAAFDFTLSDPGNYPMVTHSFADAQKGAVAVFSAAP